MLHGKEAIMLEINWSAIPLKKIKELEAGNTKRKFQKMKGSRSVLRYECMPCKKGHLMNTPTTDGGTRRAKRYRAKKNPQEVENDAKC